MIFKMVNNFSIVSPNVTGGTVSGDDKQSQVFLIMSVSWGILGLLSFVLNFAVCILMYCDKKLWTITNYFVVSLSVADLLVSTVLIPLVIAEKFQESTTSGHLIAFLLVASIYNMCAVTYERYVALTRPFHYRSIMSKRRALYVIALAWIVPTITALLPVAWDANPSTVFHEAYIVILVFIIVLVPCVAMILIYLRLFFVVRSYLKRNRRRTTKGNRTGDRAGSEEKATMVFALILAMFLFCWLPIIWMNIAFIFKNYELINMPLKYASFFTIVLNTILDPLIYAFLKKDFNDALKRKLKFGCIRQIERGCPENECITLQTVEVAEHA